ncbi:hypothetical protein BKM77_05185 [Pseudomonas syringae]|nr:hypothetical protein BKM77_05185 [Pseudomonas syringae]
MFIGDSTKAVPYGQIATHPELEQACANYVAAVYGDNVAKAIPIAQREVHVGILYGYTELQVQEMILGMYGLQPL